LILSVDVTLVGSKIKVWWKFGDEISSLFLAGNGLDFSKRLPFVVEALTVLGTKFKAIGGPSIIVSLEVVPSKVGHEPPLDYFVSSKARAIIGGSPIRELERVRGTLVDIKSCTVFAKSSEVWNCVVSVQDGGTMDSVLKSWLAVE